MSTKTGNYNGHRFHGAPERIDFKVVTLNFNSSKNVGIVSFEKGAIINNNA